MKKTLLFIGLVAAVSTSQAQVTTYVTQPAEFEGALDFTWADNWGMTPDLNLPENSITAFVVIGRDATEDQDSLGCEALVNAAEVSGKIAAIYRGTCEFGLKALNAQNAGAIGVVIINNQGAPAAMGGGVNGAEVTIPVVMISTDAGTMLHDEIVAGNVEMLIGSVMGVYEFNLNTASKQAMIPQYSALPGALATAIGFGSAMGTWVKNFGYADQSDVSVTGTVTNGGNTVYDETSATATVISGDSAYFALPDFAQGNYDGLYEATYTINSPNEDAFPTDNIFTWNYLASDVFAYARIDPTNLLPIGEQHVRTADGVTFQTCSYFSHPNASMFTVEGIYTSGAKSGGVTMQDEYLEGRLFEWLDVFTGWSDATTNDIIMLASGEYVYDSDLSQETIYIPLQEPYELEDNKKYLFCSFSPSADVFLGFGESLNYERLQADLDEPIYLMTDGTWGSFSNADHCAVGAKLTQMVGVDEHDRVELKAFPNPTSTSIQIPMIGLSGKATLQIYNALGENVGERSVAVGDRGIMTVDMSGMSAGTYVFHMEFENGKRSDFRVVVSK
jgi:hypothetical protein